LPRAPILDALSIAALLAGSDRALCDDELRAVDVELRSSLEEEVRVNEARRVVIGRRDDRGEEGLFFGAQSKMPRAAAISSAFFSES